MYRTSSKMWDILSVACCDEIWYHIVMTWDSVNTRLYINGLLSNTAQPSDVTQSDQGNDDFVIGTANNNKGNVLGEFCIDEMIYKDEMMSDEEVQQLFTGEFHSSIECDHQRETNIRKSETIWSATVAHGFQG